MAVAWTPGRVTRLPFRLNFPDDVKAIAADSALSILELELDAERLSQPISVPRQPRPFC